MSFPSLLTAKTQPRNQEQSEMFLRLLLNETHAEFTKEQAIDFRFTGLVLLKRLELCQIKVSIILALWIIVLSDGNPGRIVMWAWTAREMWLKQSKKMVDLNDWVTAFPLGVPTDEEYSRVWGAQKQEGAPAGNALDRIEVWEEQGKSE